MSFDASTAVLDEAREFDVASATLVEDEAPAFDASTATLDEAPAPSPMPTPFEELPTGMVPLDPLPQAKPSALPDPAVEQESSLSRDALADRNAMRGIFTPDSAPYRLVGDHFAIDPLRYDDAAGQLWKDGLIDSDEYFRMMNDAVEIKPAAQQRRDLEAQAGRVPELKSALYGLSKGLLQAGGALAVGGSTATALAPTGPGAVVGGIAAGTGTAIVLGDMVDTFSEKIAENNDFMKSIMAARALRPGYDTAGQLASVLVPAPSALLKLKTAAQLIAAERGAGEAAKFTAKVLGTGAGIGAATDLAVQGAVAGVNLVDGKPVDFSLAQLGVSSALGALTAGLGVRSQNRIYQPEELVALERRAHDGTASFDEFRDYSTMRSAVETLRQDERLLSADAVRRATADFGGTQALDVTEIINPRFQQAALADAGFVPPPAAPAPRPALPPVSQPAAELPTNMVPLDPITPAVQPAQSPVVSNDTVPVAVEPAAQAITQPAAVAPAPATSFDPATAQPVEPETQSTLGDFPAVNYPVAGLKLSKDVPNFKEDADPTTGVVAGEALQGKVDRRGLAPIQGWRRLNGDVEVISGRHRLDLFRRNGEQTIPTQIFNEADGFTLQDALTLDAELNIKDEKGTIKDFAAYFRNSPVSEQQAVERGLLSRSKGISGFAIGRGGSDDLYAAFAAGRISDAKAAAIARAAPGDADMQRVGMQFAKELSAPELTSFIQVNRLASQPGAKQGDLFGNSDANLNNAAALVKASRKRIQEIDNQILSVKGAVKRPEAARQMGVDVTNPESIRARMVELEAQKEKYIRFYDHPDTLAEVRALAFPDAAPVKPPTETAAAFNLSSEPEAPTAAPVEPVDEEAARIEAIRKSGYDNTPSMFDAGPLPTKPSGKRSGSSYADAGPAAAMPKPASGPIPKPDMATYSDAQVYADYPEAVGVVRSKGPGWTMPLILGGTDKVPVMEMPEMIEFYRSIIGKDPAVRKMRGLGSFDPDSALVSMRPDLFGDEKSALMTLAHEIGHATGWMDDGELRLGNIGGHIMNVKGFLKGTFPLDPLASSGKPINKAEQANIRKQAEADLIKSLEGEVRTVIIEEPVFATTGVTPEIVKDLFGLNAREKYPEMYKWFALQSGEVKKQIVKAAMKGLVDQRMAQFSVQGEQIGTTTRQETKTVGGRAPTPEEFREAIDNAMRAEMQKRNVADVKFVRDELIALSVWWKPFDYNRAGDAYIKYRHSAVELYADAISVLFNSPADLEKRAPVFYSAFWNYLDARPKVKASIFEIQNRIQNGRDAVLDKRLDRDLAAMKTGRETFLRKHNAAQERRRSLTGWWESMKDQYWNQYQPALDAVNKANASGKITPAEADSYRWMLEEHPLADSKLQVVLADIGRIYQSLDEAGVSRDMLGIRLKYDRMANERQDVMQEIEGEMVKVGETGRATLANPGGETSRTATEMLAKIRASLTPERNAALDKAVSGFRSQVFKVMEDANNSGLFSPEIWDTITANQFTYATFTPLEYVEDYLPAAIKKQVGTFKDIADPLQQTVLLMIAVHRAAQDNRFKQGVAAMLRDVAPELITAAPMKYNGKAMVPQPPRNNELELLQWKEAGQLQGLHIPKRHAAMFDDKSPAERDGILRLLSTVFQTSMYNSIIRYNPAFQFLMSPARDLNRSLTNMPGGFKGRRKFIASLFKPSVWGASIDWARGDIGRSALLREMIENAAVGGPHSAFGGKLQGDDDALVAILRKFHVASDTERNALHRMIMKPLRAIEFGGQVLQLLPKASAYQVMAKDLGMNAPQAANTIRNHIGLPNIYKRGRHAAQAGALVPFLNVFLRSYESLYRNMTGKERNMGGKEWWIAWTLAGGGLLAALQTLAREGVFGEDLQRLYSRVSEMDMTNYAILPVGETSTGDTGGKTAFLRFPQDEGLRVINGVMSKILQSSIRTAKGDPTAPNLGDVFAGINSNVPGTNPLIEIGQNWVIFLANGNPRDNFRNRNILTEDQWLAGGWDAVKPMMGWTLGATGITNFFNYDSKADTLTELTISATPVLNRFLKYSDRGIYQTEKSVEQADARDMAKMRLSLPLFVQGLKTEFFYLRGRGERRSEREEERYGDLLFWNRSYRMAMDEVEASMEMGNKPVARDAIQGLIEESKQYRQRD